MEAIFLAKSCWYLRLALLVVVIPTSMEEMMPSLITREKEFDSVPSGTSYSTVVV